MWRQKITRQVVLTVGIIACVINVADMAMPIVNLWPISVIPCAVFLFTWGVWKGKI